MNRDILKETFVQNGHSYANDALQTICEKLCQCHGTTYKTLDLLQRTDLSPEEETEKNRLTRNNRTMIALFDSIVEQGRDFAIKFIDANTHLFIK